jgi:hypothetical protein
MSEIEWSYSKRSTLKTCAKAYYFSYFGANKLTAKGELDKERLHFLKQLQNLHERAGDLLHLTIATYFRHAHQGNTWIFDTERLINWTRKMFHNDRKYSRAYPDGDEKAKKNFGRSPTLLQEFHYRDADADRLWQETETRLVKAVRSFATNDDFEGFRIAGCQPNALIEHPINMAVYNVKVVGRIDLAFQVGDRITVVDWKIGSDTLGGSSSLQLAVYALWAVTHFNQPWDKIDVNMVQLESNRIITNEINEDELAAVRLRILQDAELMTTLQNYGKKAVSEAFTPLLHPPICSLCQFKRVCYA